MTQEEKNKTIRLYESFMLTSVNCFNDVPEIVSYMNACKEFKEKQEIFETFLYSDNLETKV